MESMNLEDLPNYGIALEKLKDVPVKALTSHETFENLRETYFPYVLKASPFTSSNDYSTYLIQCYRHHMSCYKLRLERHKYLYEPNMCEKSACAARREREREQANLQKWQCSTPERQFLLHHAS